MDQPVYEVESLGVLTYRQIKVKQSYSVTERLERSASLSNIFNFILPTANYLFVEPLSLLISDYTANHCWNWCQYKWESSPDNHL